MQRYCLDADVFIQAKNGPYGMDIVPAFWNWMDQQAETGKIYTSVMVYEELAIGDDELAEWAHARKKSRLFIEPDEKVQEAFQGIAAFVTSKYQNHHASFFLDGADPWVIAHAKVDKAVVVTHEMLVSAESSKVKIPTL